MPRHHSTLGSTLDRSHLRELRPIKVSQPGRNERFAVPHIKELQGTPFALCPDERQFVVSMVDGRRRQGLRKHNVVLFRPDQRKFAGDFVCVDVSAPPRNRGTLSLPSWDVFVIDLKMGARLQIGGGGAGIQFKNATAAAELAHKVLAERQVGPGESARKGWQRFVTPRETWLLAGDRDEVLGFFRHLRLVRRQHRRCGDKQTIIPMLESQTPKKNRPH